MINRNIPLTDEEEAQQKQDLIGQISGLNAVKVPALKDIKNPVMAPEMSLNELIDRSDDPLFVEKELLGKVERGDIVTGGPGFKDPMNPVPAIDVAPVVPKDDGSYKATNFANTINIPSTYGDDTSDKPKLTEREQLLKQYEDLIKKQDEDVANARKSDQNKTLIGALGDSLGTYLNAKGQMNVKAPGVKVEQGVGALDIAKQFQTGDKVAADLKARREALLEQYKALAKEQGGELTPYQQKSLNLEERRLNLQEKLEGGREGRFRDNLDLRKEIKGELTPKQLETITGFDMALDGVDRLESLKTFSTGPIEGRLQAALRYIGQAPGNKTALAAQLNQLLSSYGKAISGTAIGEGEFKRLEDQLPNEKDSNEQFASKLINFRTNLENARFRTQDNLSKAGKSVEKFKEREPLRQEEKVIVIGPNGKANKLPKRQLEAALKQGYKLQE